MIVGPAMTDLGPFSAPNAQVTPWEVRSGEAELWCIKPTKAFANSDGKRFSQTRYRWYS